MEKRSRLCTSVGDDIDVDTSALWPKNCGAAQLLLKEEVFLMQKRITFVYEEKVKKYERERQPPTISTVVVGV